MTNNGQATVINDRYEIHKRIGRGGMADVFSARDLLLDRQVAYEEKRFALIKKYKDEMLKVLPAKTVARFLQVDSRLNKLAELAVASEIPLVY